jgi:hypothetical protein
MVGFQAPCARGRMVLYLREGERHLGNKRAHCQIGHVGYRIDAYSPSLLARVMAILGIGIRPIAATRAFCHFIPLRMELLLHPGPIGREQIMHVREQGTGQPDSRLFAMDVAALCRRAGIPQLTTKDEASRCENLAPSKRRVAHPFPMVQLVAWSIAYARALLTIFWELLFGSVRLPRSQLSVRTHGVDKKLLHSLRGKELKAFVVMPQPNAPT